jgi:flagellar hook-basal body complex protein FliE
MPTPTTAANAYAALAKLQEQAAKLGGDTPESGPSFSSLLKDTMDAVSTAAHKSDGQAQAVAEGKANMIDVVTAVAETETTFQTLVSVRDKVIAAYEDVLKMQI